jgi:hypothetical protein
MPEVGSLENATAPVVRAREQGPWCSRCVEGTFREPTEVQLRRKVAPPQRVLRIALLNPVARCTNA